MSSESVSVVILNYNGQRHLGKILQDCVESVLDTNYPNFEVLFVDNASTDDSVDLVRGKFGQDPRLRIIRNEKNLGFTGGNNRGIRNSKGKYIVVLNSDVRVEPDWLTELVKAVQSPEIGAAQSKLLRMDAPEVLDCAGGLLDFYGYQLERGRGENHRNYNQPSEIFYAKGASVLIKREVLNKTGLFDPEVFMYFDEVDLCWRIWLSGYKVVYAPGSVVYHASGSTASKMQQQQRLFFYARNHILLLLKNYNLANAIKAVKVSLLFEARNMILLLARRRPLVSVSILKGLLWNLLHLKRTWTQRQTVQSIVRKVPDEEIQRQMLKPYPPFPLYLVFSRSKYERNKRGKR